MRLSPERIIRNTEFQSALLVGGLEMAKMAGQVWRLQAISTGTEFDAIPVALNFILDHSGDFAAGYLGTWVINSFSQKYSDRRLNASTAVAAGACILAETLPTGMTHNLLGSPHIADLGAAALGILSYRSLNKFLRRNLLPKDK